MSGESTGVVVDVVSVVSANDATADEDTNIPTTNNDNIPSRTARAATRPPQRLRSDDMPQPLVNGFRHH